MWEFLTGFVVALLAAIPAIVMFLRKKISKTQTNKQAYLKQLEELGRLTGELAHEIKNPLSTIKINLKLAAEELQGSAEDDRSSARALRKISVIQNEANRLEQILDGFLRYMDRDKLQLATVDVNSLLSDMIDFYTPQAHSHSITIRMGLCNRPLVCKLDVDMLKQAILNLFINAQQAISGGGELMIKTDSDENQVIIQISDTGCGIESEKLPNIFSPHYSSRPEGSGLGLPTVKKIVEAHKGTISVDSEPGKGTLFTIKLPLES